MAAIISPFLALAEKTRGPEHVIDDAIQWKVSHIDRKSQRIEIWANALGDMELVNQYDPKPVVNVRYVEVTLI